MKITGKVTTRQVFIDGKELLPDRSQALINHSPDGFMWGYEGSGPAQLALAILLEMYSEQKALDNYQDFKRTTIAPLPMDEDFEIEMSSVIVADHIKKRA